jgi:hypothetical protein
MASNERLRRRIEAMAAELREEFGQVSPDEAGCLLLPVEEWAVAVGDQLSRAVMQDQLERTPGPVEAPRCPTCAQPAAGAEAARGDAPRTDRRERTGVLLPPLSAVFFSLGRARWGWSLTAR